MKLHGIYIYIIKRSLGDNPGIFSFRACFLGSFEEMRRPPPPPPPAVSLSPLLAHKTSPAVLGRSVHRALPFLPLARASLPCSHPHTHTRILSLAPSLAPSLGSLLRACGVERSGVPAGRPSSARACGEVCVCGAGGRAGGWVGGWVRARTGVRACIPCERACVRACGGGVRAASQLGVLRCYCCCSDRACRDASLALTAATPAGRAGVLFFP